MKQCIPGCRLLLKSVYVFSFPLQRSLKCASAILYADCWEVSKKGIAICYVQEDLWRNKLHTQCDVSWQSTVTAVVHFTTCFMWLGTFTLRSIRLPKWRITAEGCLVERTGVWQGK